MTTDKIYTTLKQIRAHTPCTNGYKKLVKSLGGISEYGEDTPVTFRQIYDSNGYFDTLWCLKTVDPKWYPLWRHFACDCADDVRHLMTDKRSTAAIDAARRYADGLVTDTELTAARDAASAASDAAWAAAAAARAKALDVCDLIERVHPTLKPVLDTIRAGLQPRGRPLDPDMPTQEIKLHMGEMTAQEERTARAAIRWANKRINQPTNEGGTHDDQKADADLRERLQ